MNKKRSLHLLVIIALFSVVGAWLPGVPAQAQTLRLGLSVSTQSNSFYRSLAQGVADEGKALGAEVTVLSADDQLEKQISDVEDLIAADIDVLLINAVQGEAVGVIEDAISMGIPVITLQRAVASSQVTSHLGTDNVLIGKLAAEWLVDKLDGQGKVVVLEGIPGAASSEDRKAGSTPVFAAAPGIEIVAQQTAEYDRATALSVMENILQATPDIDAVFCYNDEMAMGVLAALEAEGRDDVLITGIDALPDAVEAVQQGKLAMTIRIPVYDMGRLGARYAMEVAAGNMVPVQSVIPAVFVTPENVDAAAEPAPADTELLIGVSVSTQSNSFYRSLAEGAAAESVALGYKANVLSADDQLEKQLSDVEDLIAADIDVLLINPTQGEAVGVIEDAARAGIPVITMQRAVASSQVTSHLGTDNVLIGKLAAEWLVDKLDGQGKVVVLEGIPGAASSEDRKAGSTPVFAAAPGIEIVAQQTAEYDRATALSVMENILQATPDIDAVFCYNDEMAMGVLAALEAEGRDDVLITGIDALPDAVEAVQQGKLAMTIRIPVYDMGRWAARFGAWTALGEITVPVRNVIPIEFITP
ncbi:MAG: substrate-binding domain-containing protein [Anaerolineae bacterium]|nr:substrate-binding domain-containing protein [Anaerolineae bacterium]